MSSNGGDDDGSSSSEESSIDIEDPVQLIAEPKPANEYLSLTKYATDDSDWHERARKLPLVGAVGTLYNFVTRLTARADKNFLTTLNFCLNKTGLEEGEGETWIFKRFLGAGNFGRVAEFVRLGADGKQTDAVAIKEIDKVDDRPASTKHQLLPSEVAINADLNHHDIDYICYLRGYRFGRTSQRGRMYMKVYRHGSLDDLITMYTMYGYCLPEWFILEVIRDLCTGLEAMAKQPPTDSLYDPWTSSDPDVDDQHPLNDNLQTIHLDLKPANIFLGEAMLADNGLEKPRAVIADFGLSEYTCDTDPLNPTHLDAGTPNYMTPELLNKSWKETKDQYAIDKAKRGKAKVAMKTRRNYPISEYPTPAPDADGEKAYSGRLVETAEELAAKYNATASNVYGLGRIVFDLMTTAALRRPEDWGLCLKMNDNPNLVVYAEEEESNQSDENGSDVQRRPQLKSEFAEYYVADSRLPVTNQKMLDLIEPLGCGSARDYFPYSDGLTKLLSDMLAPKQVERPSVQTVTEAVATLLPAARSKITLEAQRPREPRILFEVHRKPWSMNIDTPGRVLFKAADYANTTESQALWPSESEKDKQWLAYVHETTNQVLQRWDPEEPLPTRPRWFEEDHDTKWQRLGEDLNVVKPGLPEHDRRQPGPAAQYNLKLGPLDGPMADEGRIYTDQETQTIRDYRNQGNQTDRAQEDQPPDQPEDQCEAQSEDGEEEGPVRKKRKTKKAATRQRAPTQRWQLVQERPATHGMRLRERKKPAN